MDLLLFQQQQIQQQQQQQQNMMILQGWANFPWQVRRQEMEETLAAAKEAREQSLAARKSLAETTKQFKKSVKTLEQQQNSNDVVESLGKQSRNTVKAYQEEIDHLTRRCKAAESSYASLCQDLFALVDPYPLLQQQQAQMEQMNNEMQTLEQANQALKKELAAATAAAATATSAATSSSSNAAAPASSSASSSSALAKEEREELLQLRREVAEYEVEFRSLKNQDITIRKLEAKIVDLQKTAAQEFAMQLEQAKQELQETEGRRAAEALEREAIMERKVQTLELQLKAERAGREATQAHMFQADEGVSQREAAWEAQKRILVDDADRLREQLHVITAERDELSLRLATLKGVVTNSSSSSTASFTSSSNKGPASGMGGMAASGSKGSMGGGVLQTPPPSGSGMPAVSMADLILERKAYEAEVTELSETTTLLREELRQKEEAWAAEKRQSSLKIQTLERKTSELTTKVNTLEGQLASAPSVEMVETMKRELRILKRLEYNAETDAEHFDDDTLDPEIAGFNKEDEKNSLEAVLVAKLRRAESDLVTERTSRTTLRQEIESLKQALAEAEKKKADLELLVSSLEKDLEKAISSAPLAAATSMSGLASNKTTLTTTSSRAGSRTSKLDLIPTEGKPSTLQQVLDPDAPLPPPPPPTPEPAMLSSTTAQERADDDHSVATIVMAQRDRLRARCDALEAERDSFKRELQAQVQATESLKSDNTKLYEKVRYLQNNFYNKSSSTSGGYNNSNLNKRSASMVAGGSAYAADRDLDLEALEQRYEASVDPFRQFSRAERQRKLNEMSPMERTVFIVAKTFLATKEMRTALFFYVLAMHLLVFVTTYHWSHTTSGCHTSMADLEHLTHLPPALPVGVADGAGGEPQGAAPGNP